MTDTKARDARLIAAVNAPFGVIDHDDLAADLTDALAELVRLREALTRIERDPIDEPATWGGAAEWMRRIARAALSPPLINPGDGGKS